MIRIFNSKHVSDNPSIVGEILSICSSYRIFAFFGQLGSGKTTLIRDFCKALGVEEDVTSPTFTIVNEYQGDKGSIYHFDFFRLENETEAYNLGFEEYFDSGCYCFIEWPERIPTLLPDTYVNISVTPLEETERLIEVIYGERSILS